MAVAVTNFPGALDDNLSLCVAANGATTTLTVAATNSVTTLTVVSTSLFPSSGIVVIESEKIAYTGKTSTTFTGCTRAYEGTAAASHAIGIDVDYAFTAQMHNVLINTLLAIETKLGVGASTPTNGLFFVGNTAAGTSQWRAFAASDIPAHSAALLTSGTLPDGRLSGNVPLLNAVNIFGQELQTTSTATTPGLRLLPYAGDPSTPANGHIWYNSATNKFRARENGVNVDMIGGGGGSGDMILANVQTVTGAKTFNDTKLIIGGGNYGAGDGSLPAVVAKSFITNLQSNRLFFGKPDGSAWAEIYLAGVSTPINTGSGGTGLSTYAQGDLIYASATNTLAKLAKSTTANQFLKNSGTSNNPAWDFVTEHIAVAASDETTALTTGTSKVTFHMPYAFTVTEVIIGLSTAQASGTIFTVDVNKNGTSILSTKATIDNTEETSVTAATPPVLTGATFAKGDRVTVDIDQIGNGSATGLKVYLVGHQ